jgi:hypothetical protein
MFIKKMKSLCIYLILSLRGILRKAGGESNMKKGKAPFGSVKGFGKNPSGRKAPTMKPNTKTSATGSNISFGKNIKEE